MFFKSKSRSFIDPLVQDRCLQRNLDMSWEWLPLSVWLDNQSVGRIRESSVFDLSLRDVASLKKQS